MRKIFYLIFILLFVASCKDYMDIKYIANNAPEIVNGTDGYMDIVCLFSREADQVYLSHRRVPSKKSTAVSINKYSPFVCLIVGHDLDFYNKIDKYMPGDYDKDNIVVNGYYLSAILEDFSCGKKYTKLELQYMINSAENKEKLPYFLFTRDGYLTMNFDEGAIYK